MSFTSEFLSKSKEILDFLEIALVGSPPDIAEQLKAGLKKRYEQPPVDEMAMCLGRHVPLSKARQLLFSPTVDDMRLYPVLIAMPPSESPENHPQQKVQVCALASLYLVHSKRWELVQPFIEAGGLRQLAAALSHTNPYLASQAMSALMHITDEGLLFPWHDPPPSPDGLGLLQGPYALVWRSMFDLSRNDVFLSNLVGHYRHPPIFPGATCMALRLLAFYLSWLRKNFTPDGRLYLSASLLDVLQRWAADAQVSSEERELARALHKDFSRFPPAQRPPQADGSNASSAGLATHHLGGLSAEDEPVTTVVSERTEINSGTQCTTDNEAEALKEQGNEAYRCGDFSTAIQLYSAALDALVPMERMLTEGPRRAAYHTNRAAAYMARAAAGILREGYADTMGHLESVDHGSEGIVWRHYQAAVIDCDAALDLQPTGRAAAKALLRKSRALLQLGRREEAAAAARSGLYKYDSDDTLGGSCATAAVRVELQEALRTAQQQQERETKGLVRMMERAEVTQEIPAQKAVKGKLLTSEAVETNTDAKRQATQVTISVSTTEMSSKEAEALRVDMSANHSEPPLVAPRVDVMFERGTGETQTLARVGVTGLTSEASEGGRGFGASGVAVVGVDGLLYRHESSWGATGTAVDWYAMD